MLEHSSSISSMDAKMMYLQATFPSLSSQELCTLVNAFTIESKVAINEFEDSDLITYVANYRLPETDHFSAISECYNAQLSLSRALEQERQVMRQEALCKAETNVNRLSGQKSNMQTLQYDKKNECNESESQPSKCNVSATKNDTKVGDKEGDDNDENVGGGGGGVSGVVDNKAILETVNHSRVLHKEETKTQRSNTENVYASSLFGAKDTHAPDHSVINALCGSLLTEQSQSLLPLLFAKCNFAALSQLHEYNRIVEFLSVDTAEWDAMFLHNNKENLPMPSLPYDVYLPIDDESEELEEEKEKEEEWKEGESCEEERKKKNKNEEEILSEEEINVEREIEYNQLLRTPIITWAPTSLIVTNNSSNNNNDDNNNNNGSVSDENGDNNNIMQDDDTKVRFVMKIADNDNNCSFQVCDAVKDHTNIKEIPHVTNNINKCQENVYLIRVQAHDNADENVQTPYLSHSITEKTTTSSKRRKEENVVAVVRHPVVPPSVQFAELVGLQSSSTNVTSPSDVLLNEKHLNNKAADKTTLVTNSLVPSRHSASRLSSAFPLCEWVINASSPNAPQEQTTQVNEEECYQEWSERRSRWREEQEQEQQEQQEQQWEQLQRRIKRAQSEQVQRLHFLHPSWDKRDSSNATHEPFDDIHEHVHLKETREKIKHDHSIVKNCKLYHAQSVEPTYLSTIWSEMNASAEKKQRKDHLLEELPINDNNNDTTANNNNNEYNEKLQVNLSSINEMQQRSFAATECESAHLQEDIYNTTWTGTHTCIANHETESDNVKEEITRSDASDTSSSSSSSSKVSSVIVAANDAETISHNNFSFSSNGVCSVNSFNLMEYLESEERRAHIMMNAVVAKGVEFDHNGKCQIASLIFTKCPAMVDLLHHHLAKILELVALLVKGVELLSEKDEMSIQVPITHSRKLLAHGPLILSDVEFDMSKSSIKLHKETELNLNQNKCKCRTKNGKTIKNVINKLKNKCSSISAFSKKKKAKENGSITKKKLANGQETNVVNGTEEEHDENTRTCFAMNITIKEIKTVPLSFAFIDEYDAFRQSHSSRERAAQLESIMLSECIHPTLKQSTLTTRATKATISSTTEHEKNKLQEKSTQRAEEQEEESSESLMSKKPIMQLINTNTILYYNHGVTSGTMNVVLEDIRIQACASLTLSLTRVMALNIDDVHLRIGNVNISISVWTLNVLCTLLKPIIKRILKRRLKTFLKQTHYL